MTISIKTPKWYFNSHTPAADVITNVGFFAASVIAYHKKLYLFATALMLVAIGSTIFHIWPSEKTLFIDRIAMIFGFSVVNNFSYPQIPVIIYFAIGFSTIIHIQNLTPYAIYQFASIVMLLFRFRKNPKIWIIAALFGVSSALQAFNVPYFHALKHILIALAIIWFIIII